jgi:hypothetical protein
VTSQDCQQRRSEDPFLHPEECPVGFSKTDFQLLRILGQKYGRVLPGLWPGSQPHYGGHVFDVPDQPGAPNGQAKTV